MRMHSTPPSLLERLRRPGEEDAWDRFVQLYTPLLFHWARSVGLRDADAADLVQDVLVLLVRKLPEFTYDRHRSFRAWLRTVTLNKWREWRRRRPEATFENADALDAVAARDEMAAFEEAEYCRQLVQQALHALRDEFPQTTWEAFRLYAVEEQDADAVAAALGVSVGTVYAAKSRVLTRLRRELEGLLD
jgi:RNA polymerase sigma-70 factor (ECF subfamily)